MGLFGVLVGYTIWDVQLGIGVAHSVLLQSGTQFGALARVRFLAFENTSTVHAFALTGTFSEGPHSTYGGTDSGYWTMHAYWLSGTLDYERQAKTGFRFTAGFGVRGMILATDLVRHDLDSPAERLRRGLSPGIRLTVGWAL